MQQAQQQQQQHREMCAPLTPDEYAPVPWKLKKNRFLYAHNGNAVEFVFRGRPAAAAKPTLHFNLLFLSRLETWRWRPWRRALAANPLRRPRAPSSKHSERAELDASKAVAVKGPRSTPLRRARGASELETGQPSRLSSGGAKISRARDRRRSARSGPKPRSGQQRRQRAAQHKLGATAEHAK
jgi:hypothetical protein